MVTVLGGVAGPWAGGGACAMARRDPSAAAPATAPIVVKSMRRERGSSAIAEPPLENDRGNRVASARGGHGSRGAARSSTRAARLPLAPAGAAGPPWD